MRRSQLRGVCPWVPPPRHDIFKTVPPPPGGEVGGSYGVSTGYSPRIAEMPYWKRMAVSNYKIRMQENATYYPMSRYRPGEYDLRYTVVPYPDAIRHRPLLEVGEPRLIPRLHIPVIFLVDLWDPDKQKWWGRKFETVYVSSSVARTELIPQRYAIYATSEAYELLGLPVRKHHVHDEIPKTPRAYQRLLEKQSYEEERWRYSIEFLFRRYADGPPELLDQPEEAGEGGFEAEMGGASSGEAKASDARGKAVRKLRKARKEMSSAFLKYLLHPIQQNPTLGSIVGTGAACGLIYWWYNTSIRATLVQTQQNCHRITEKALEECREMLKGVEKNWGVDIRSRDAHVRRLELQNVEQTRSVARLEMAMKSCLAQSSQRETAE